MAEFEGSAEDPAAEFLAREQNQMAGLEDDNFGEAAPAGWKHQQKIESRSTVESKRKFIPKMNKRPYGCRARYRSRSRSI